MPPGLTLPASLAGLLGALRPCFTAPSFRTFCGLAAGLAGQVRRRTVCGMLLGAGLARAWPGPGRMTGRITSSPGPGSSHTTSRSERRHAARQVDLDTDT